MKFQKVRVLKDNMFTTRINRVEDDSQDCVLEERVLENDFGPVVVEVGGKFEAIITKDDDKLKFTPITSVNAEQANRANFKFAIPTSKTPILMGTKIEFSCDAKEESTRVYEDIALTPLKAAEIKCKVFEAVMLDRIESSINDWKANKTDFESEILDPVHFSLV